MHRTICYPSQAALFNYSTCTNVHPHAGRLLSRSCSFDRDFKHFGVTRSCKRGLPAHCRGYDRNWYLPSRTSPRPVSGVVGLGRWDSEREMEPHFHFPISHWPDFCGWCPMKHRRNLEYIYNVQQLEHRELIIRDMASLPNHWKYYSPPSLRIPQSPP